MLNHPIDSIFVLVVIVICVMRMALLDGLHGQMVVVCPRTPSIALMPIVLDHAYVAAYHALHAIGYDLDFANEMDHQLDVCWYAYARRNGISLEKTSW